MPVAHHPEATGCAMKFPGACSHGTFEGGIGHNLPQEAPDAYAHAEVGGCGT
jgi:predicted nucleic acid binding AN1-type Zn finger protein